MSAQQNLLDAMDDLEQALALSPGLAWSQHVDEVLAHVEEALLEHAQEIAATDGLLIDVDRPLLPSPTVQHGTAKLTAELCDLVAQTRSLRRKDQGVAVPTNPHDGAPIAGPQFIASHKGTACDLELFRKRTRQLVEALEHCEKQEADLILDSVNTDIGAGD